MSTQAKAAKNDSLAAQCNRKKIFGRKSELERKLKDLDEKNQELQKTMHNGKVIENLV